jgi:hypothetical protein
MSSSPTTAKSPAPIRATFSTGAGQTMSLPQSIGPRLGPAVRMPDALTERRKELVKTLVEAHASFGTTFVTEVLREL